MTPFERARRRAEVDRLFERHRERVAKLLRGLDPPTPSDGARVSFLDQCTETLTVRTGTATRVLTQPADDTAAPRVELAPSYFGGAPARADERQKVRATRTTNHAVWPARRPLRPGELHADAPADADGGDAA